MGTTAAKQRTSNRFVPEFNRDAALQPERKKIDWAQNDFSHLPSKSIKMQESGFGVPLPTGASRGRPAKGPSMSVLREKLMKKAIL